MKDKKIAILYGSETGNAQDFANILSHKLKRLHFPHTLTNIGDYNPKSILKCKYMFIICSTTGQGELPRNARENYKGHSQGTLWQFMKKKNLPSNFLDHLNVALLGLGDSSYPRFNFGIRKLHERMVNQLGAIEIFPRLEADELGLAGSNKNTGNGSESVYFEFEKKVLSYLTEKYPTRVHDGKVVPRVMVDQDVYLKPSNILEITDDNGNNKKVESENNIRFVGDESIRKGTVKLNKQITAPDHFQDVRQFVFETEHHESYQPGDTVCLYPENLDSDVQAFLDAQSCWKDVADKPLTITNLETCELFKDGGLVEPLTLRTLLKYHLDIMSIPRPSFFMKIWTFATDLERLSFDKEQLEQQREKLRQFGYDEDLQDLYDYCNRPRRSILEVVQDFESLKLPWEFVLDFIPIMKPRFYSISSKPSDHNIELTIAVVRYKTILRRIRKGVLTNFLISLSENETIRYKLQHNNLIHDDIIGKPIIMISPGVGLAPMRSLIKSEIFNELYLFFGNRMKNKDYLYGDELSRWNEEGKIKLFTCFSRDPVNSPDAKYVQDQMWNHSELLANLILNKSAVIYICGSSGKMPVQVRLTILEILKKHGDFKNDDDAEHYLKEMEKTDRYMQETW
ncbi:putative NADPH reductase TAH18 [Kluyveromyces marxianus]|uniref:NADPH-dependent diflavin oxidoreductase 1 n=1 Tax=Kluyveromyces marxianus TaxID=4911 RepID=A0ABX6F146_KLUMA|nr:putative NADPH reductase TAH18 [Kluyveromyces marxianus]